MSAMSRIGAIAAPASANLSTTSWASRSEIHEPITASSSSWCSSRPVWPANHGSATMSLRPTRRMVRSAVDWVVADMPSQTPSLLLYRLRGAVNGARFPLRP